MISLSEEIDGVNLLNVNLENNIMDNNCIICHMPLSFDNCYRLPECHHTFHTSCIVTWFRAGDSSCPICRNRGINHNADSDKHLSRSILQKNVKFKTVLSYVKNNHEKCSKYILDLINKYKKSVDQLNDCKNEMTNFVKSLKNTEVDYFEASKKKRYIRHRIYSKERDMYKYKREIIMIPIVPIIIPSFVLMD